MNPHDRLSPALWESWRQAAALVDALAEWRTLGEISHQRLEADRMLTRLVDQILSRFTKLQDSIGERLIPATIGAAAALLEALAHWASRLPQAPGPAA